MTKKWTWLSEALVLAAHDDQLARNGGASGLRDEGLLESALMRPQNQAVYGEPSVFDLAAAYAFGVISNHPFIDGNKRSGFLLCCVFLDLNDWEIDAPEPEAYMAVLSLAQKEIDEAAFAVWLKKNAKRAEKA